MNTPVHDYSLPEAMLKGFERLPRFGSMDPSKTGSLKEAARIYHLIAKLIGWSGVERVTRDVGMYSDAGAIAYALYSLIDDRYPNK